MARGERMWVGGETVLHTKTFFGPDAGRHHRMQEGGDGGRRGGGEGGLPMVGEVTFQVAQRERSGVQRGSGKTRMNLRGKP
jgi:hypothetical protein